MMSWPLGMAGLFLGCGSGELPTAVQQPQELYAPFVKQGPVLDGRALDAVWQKATGYRVFLDAKSGGVNLPAEGLLVDFKAVWWQETQIDTARQDTLNVIYVGFLATWPDASKSLQRKTWTYNPAESRWVRNSQGSDWLFLYWHGLSKDTDIWLWDAATTNPMGYFQDMTLEGFQSGRTIQPYLLRVDGLNFYNDAGTSRNTWDENYDDNRTPRDLSDDRPRYAWKNDPATTPPGLPPVYSDASENRLFLLESEAAPLAGSAYATPQAAVTVPGHVLETPSGGSADIRCYGRHENGRWTLEFVRKATGSENSDIPFNPKARFFSQVFSVVLGNDTPMPFEDGATAFTITNTVQLTFQFVFEE
ncbi:MAG: ethylbenzene dehydrogenase-related protein [candidate division KSB1 bacterium]|nr:ethylbenzene dehydrogenase-related protein [candidate division KSB1 bacterium]MDZ7285035.1 ethylbenzene dehydrogenase-related protein [candidate division KSB1 bacterium]MDZ7298067.1 ethylbenzene dehydrogenase-related protein [candidate division KSB1 bacterium]MDZ7349300.1 ethylbenzene dehydrogenase-related protein [candidate division KSB1 bacterium]MDZ7352733.1 ethylbenzene dehydrogenase-related protein [candidate division KSB1 bacterium]